MNARASTPLWLSFVFMASMGGATSLYAGNLEPSAPPGSTMKTLDEIPPTWSLKLADSSRFALVMGDQAVLDKETGLVWAREDWASLDTPLVSWANAVNTCHTKVLTDRRGWRLPTIDELSSVYRSNLGYLAAIFNVTQSSVRAWSSTTSPLDAAQAYIYRQGTTDNVFAQAKSSTFGVAWCVRGPGGANSQ